MGNLKIGRNGLPLGKKQKLELFQRIISGQSEFSTSRNADQSERMLFPDVFSANDNVIEYISGLKTDEKTVVVDVGIGYPSPYNLLNKAVRSGKIEYYGLEPRLGHRIGHNNGFSYRTVISENLNILRQHVRRTIKKEKKHKTAKSNSSKDHQF